MHIYLVGFMGVGKTTIGKKLANQLHLPFIDTDKLITQQTGKSIPKLFEQQGEDAFRLLESQALRSIGSEPSVIATGGGLPCYYDNMSYMNVHGVTVYLRADKWFIHSRLTQAKAPRPLIKSLNSEELLAFIEEKLAFRQAFYSQSKVQVDMPVKSFETLVNTIISLV